MSRIPRADARRNARRILEATAELIARDPDATLEQVAARAGVSRVTLYNRFSNREALMDALTERSVEEVRAALAGADPEAGSPGEAMERLLRAAWPVIGRYRGLVIVNRRLARGELRARLEPALTPLRALIRRGQQSGDFDPDLPAEWLIGILLDLIHAASAQVTAQAMDAGGAERALLRSAAAALASHR
jgi:TetR/AcrR family transcriptional regulator, mexCD-oprJ operon repressor